MKNRVGNTEFGNNKLIVKQMDNSWLNWQPYMENV